MGDSRPLSGIGGDLDLEDIDKPFGVIELEIASDREPPPPESQQTRRPGPNMHATPPAMQAVIPAAAKRSVRLEDATRVVTSDALSSLTRESTSPALDDENPVSESGIAARDDRVAAMRELYANGDADAALQLANSISSEHPPAQGGGADHPDASVYVEAGEVDVELESYGELIPVEEGTVMVSAAIEEGTEAACRGMLSLTERQSIPRILKSPAEMSKLPIDPRGGFLIAMVDGMQTLEEILDVCAMPAAEALELIEQLKELGVIEFE